MSSQTAGSPAAAGDPNLSSFMSLSSAVTGVSELDQGLGVTYLARLRASYEPATTSCLAEFLTIAGQSTPENAARQLLDDDAFRPILCQIALLWFTSTLQDPKAQTSPPPLVYGDQEEYFSGLAWEIIGAHPPGLSGGYFGHWRYRPDNEPKENS